CLGIEHNDAFGPIGWGMSAIPGASRFLPAYPGPEAAFETTSHILASPSTVGSTLFDLVNTNASPNGPYFGERELIKLAFDRYAPALPAATGTVLQDLHGTLLAPQVVSLVPIPVPNTLPAGTLDYGKEFDVAAVDVVGAITTPGQIDYYAFQGLKGDLI